MGRIDRIFLSYPVYPAHPVNIFLKDFGKEPMQLLQEGVVFAVCKN